MGAWGWWGEVRSGSFLGSRVGRAAQHLRRGQGTWCRRCAWSVHVWRDGVVGGQAHRGLGAHKPSELFSPLCLDIPTPTYLPPTPTPVN